MIVTTVMRTSFTQEDVLSWLPYEREIYISLTNEEREKENKRNK